MANTTFDTHRLITRLQKAKRQVIEFLLQASRENLRGNKMKYRVILQKSDEGYSVSCVDLPGCWSEGDTEVEALENIKDAIQEYLSAREDLLRGTPGAEIREVII
jgi:predicted RNase H-like HicB family nuclease